MGSVMMFGIISNYTSPGIPSPATNMRVVGNEYNATVYWTNPTESYFSHSIVVQKAGSAPTSLTDGKQVYNGTGTQVSVSDLSMDTTYYWAVFAVGVSGRHADTFPTGAYTTPYAPAVATGLTVVGVKYAAAISWKNPTDKNFATAVVVQKVGSAPTSITDGTEIYRGTGTSTSVSNLALYTSYHWAVFALGSNNKYRSGYPTGTYTTPDLPNHVTNFVANGSNFSATLSWVNPTSVTYHRTVVVQKVGSVPTSINDGTVVYNGTGTSVSVSTPANITTYCWAAFALDEQSRHRSGFPSTSYTPLVAPSDYNLKTTYTGVGSKTYTAPTTGWYMVELISGAGGSGATYWYYNGEYQTLGGIHKFPSSYSPATTHVLTGGGGGGSAYSCSKGIFLNKGDTIVYNVASLNRNATVNFNTTTISYSEMKCTAGTYGDAPYKISKWTPGLAGSGGKASGGNYANVNGGSGTKGSENANYKLTNIDQITPSPGGNAGGGGGYKGRDSAGIKTVQGSGTYDVSVYNSNSGDVIANEERYGFCRIYAGNTNPA